MTPMLTVCPIARARNGVIGRNGTLPWRLKTDLIHFKALTLGKPVIMGRKTWESLPNGKLPGRLNLVITRDGSFEAKGAVDEAARAKGAGPSHEMKLAASPNH